MEAVFLCFPVFPSLCDGRTCVLVYHVVAFRVSYTDPWSGTVNGNVLLVLLRMTQCEGPKVQKGNKKLRSQGEHQSILS